MKQILLLCCLMSLLCCKATAQSFNDSLLQRLNLSTEQKAVMKTIILDYKKEDKQRRNELRRKLYRQLNAEQQAILKKHWRRSIDQSAIKKSRKIK